MSDITISEGQKTVWTVTAPAWRWMLAFSALQPPFDQMVFDAIIARAKRRDDDVSLTFDNATYPKTMATILERYGMYRP